MTRREKEIKQIARKYFGDYLDGLKGEVLTVQQTFEDAAKWADEHPQFDKETFIEKACEWFKNNWREYVYQDKDGIVGFMHWESDFRKAMEEE